MCFSANASYGSAAILIAVGSYTTLANREKSRVMISLVPLLFGVQQLAEGIIWQTMGQNSSWLPRQFAILTFLGFAISVWPSYIPWSLYRIEKKPKQRKYLKILGCTGIFVSLLSFWILLRSDLSAYSVGHSLAYRISNVPRHPKWPSNLEFIFYAIPTLVPFFISTLREIRKAGYLITTAMVVSPEGYFPSALLPVEKSAHAAFFICAVLLRITLAHSEALTLTYSSPFDI